MQNEANREISVDSTIQNLKSLLKWQSLDLHNPDIELSCLFLNASQQIVDSLYFNQLTSADGAVLVEKQTVMTMNHQFSNEVKINLATLNPAIKVIVFIASAYKGDANFDKVVDCNFILSGQKEKENIQLIHQKLFVKESISSQFIGVLYNYESKWIYKENHFKMPGSNLFENENIILNTASNYLDKQSLRETNEWTRASQNKYDIHQGETIFLPPKEKEIGLGIGWTAKSATPVISVIFVNSSGKFCDKAFYGQKSSKDNSVKIGLTSLSISNALACVADDETIEISLAKVHPFITKIFVLVNIQEPSVDFSSLENIYLRVFETESKAEFCRFSLKQSSKHRGLVLGLIYRDIKSCDTWKFKAIGKFHEVEQFATGYNSLLTPLFIHHIKPYLSENPYKKPSLWLKVIVGIIQARGLTKMDVFGKSDPYVRILIDGVKQSKTKVKKVTFTPIWDEKFTIALSRHEKENKSLELKVKDWNGAMPNAFMGGVKINLKNYEINKQYDMWFPLKGKDLINYDPKFTGELNVQMNFFEDEEKMQIEFDF